MIQVIPNWHPILVHFTVALLSVSGILFIVGKLAGNWQHSETALLVAKWNFWIGASFSLLTVAAGWYAYNTVAHDTPSHLAMTTHSYWAIATVTMVLVVATWLLFSKDDKIGFIFLVPIVLMLGLLGTTAWHGGEVVYRHGLGVMSLPESSGDGHKHGHDSVKANSHHDSIDKKEGHDHSSHKH